MIIPRTFTPITRPNSTFSSASLNSNCSGATIVQDGNYSDYNNYVVNQEGISNIPVDTGNFITDFTQ